MSWSPQQQAMLAAMGYTLYRQAAPLPPVVTAPAVLAAEAPVAAAADAEAAFARLRQALQQAAGGRDLAALALPPWPELRASAAAKRALWPRLRALRRS